MYPFEDILLIPHHAFLYPVYMVIRKQNTVAQA